MNTTCFPKEVLLPDRARQGISGTKWDRVPYVHLYDVMVCTGTALALISRIWTLASDNCGQRRKALDMATRDSKPELA